MSQKITCLIPQEANDDSLRLILPLKGQETPTSELYLLQEIEQKVRIDAQAGQHEKNQSNDYYILVLNN